MGQRSLIACGIIMLLGIADGFSQKLFIHGKKEKTLYHDGWIDFNKNNKKDVYEEASVDLDKRIDDLLSQMTLEEKTCQMVTLYGYGRVAKDELPTEEWKSAFWKDGLGNIDEHLNGVARHKEAETQYSWPPSKHARAINEVQRFFVEDTRLGIPVDFTNEGIRGLCHSGATGFPAQIGIGSTWNKDLVSKIGHITGKEAKVTGYTNVYSPVLDLARDPRWGRVVECYGEDPYLVSEYGKRMVTGIQSQGVSSTVKHFALYSIPKGGRDGDTRTDPHVSIRDMHQLYLAPFKSAIKEGKALGVMSSYNDYDGIPISGSHYFLQDLLKDQWGFKGYIVSDSWAVGGLKGRHYISENYKESVYISVMAGLNVRTNFNAPENFVLPLRELVNEGRIPMEVIDSRVRDVLRVKFMLGLFDQPYVEKPDLADKEYSNSENDSIALQASRESLVLLKNDNFLPLDKENIKSILVTGPNAEAVDHSISRYGPSEIDVISVLKGIENFVGENAKVEYALGCDFSDENWPENELYTIAPSVDQQALIDEAVRKAKDVDVIVVAIGDDDRTVGESRSRTSLNLPGNQLDLVKALQKTGKPVIAVLINGRPLSVNWMNKNVPAIIEAWFPGVYGGQAIAESIFGDYNPGGKLPVTFPKTVGQVLLNFPCKKSSQGGQPARGPNGTGHTRVLGELYPFGYGLSYTTFEYSDIQLSSDTLRKGEEIEISFKLTNTGKYKGDEVPQLYIEDVYSSIVTYEKILRGFERITLNPGETQTVMFTIKPKDLTILNKEMREVTEAGVFNVFVGSSSKDTRLESQFSVGQDIKFDLIK
ncbi:glycoside hydrolase family 3 N-terminal domain-containing protein [Labilibaculum antarcticum]|uniref:beta-glucosidase n=1 Tax=Labilibaculum antarcticum TaxID=1717717 RepID=A0A1Y1CG64_9BACT|nr:glycoside hydrolase family 3 N-terminal domain-containing protein [Labilibaculum antarcticum]BAX79314.1 beta-glucosidase [Labilibaculum antarcticum]